MQELIEKRAQLAEIERQMAELNLQRKEIRSLKLSKTPEYNREKQRKWRLKNLERSRELKRLSNYKARGYVPSTYKQYLEKSGIKKPSPSIASLGTRIDDTTPIEVSLCTGCSRKFLTKLYCLWCNK